MAESCRRKIARQQRRARRTIVPRNMMGGEIEKAVVDVRDIGCLQQFFLWQLSEQVWPLEIDSIAPHQPRCATTIGKVLVRSVPEFHEIDEFEAIGAQHSVDIGK